jgi:hypothetical protein
VEFSSAAKRADVFAELCTALAQRFGVRRTADSLVLYSDRSLTRLATFSALSDGRTYFTRLNTDEAASPANATAPADAAVPRSRPGGVVLYWTLTGKTRTVDIADFSRTTVAELKQAILHKEGIPPAEQRLLFAGRQLNEDDRPVAYYDLSNYCTVTLMLRMRGS